MALARMAGLALTAMGSFAANAAEPGFYFGMAGGRAEYDFETVQVPVATLPPGAVGTPSLRFPRDPYSGGVSDYVASVPLIRLSPFGVTGYDHEDDGTSWSGFVGYRISSYFAAEVSYVSLGKLTARDTFYIYPTFAPVEFKHTLDTQGPTLSLLGILPLRDSWDIYVRAGAFFLDSKLQSAIGVSATSTTFGSEGAVFGVGTQYNFGEHWSVRLDLQRYQDVGEELASGEADIDNASVGVLYRL